MDAYGGRQACISGTTFQVTGAGVGGGPRRRCWIPPPHKHTDNGRADDGQTPKDSP